MEHHSKGRIICVKKDGARTPLICYPVIIPPALKIIPRTPTMNQHCLTRRHFLAGSSMGLGGVALSWLLHQEGLLAKPTQPELGPRTFDLLPKEPHHPPTAKAMI